LDQPLSHSPRCRGRTARQDGAIDGEAIVEVDGIPSFSAPQAALGAREGPGNKSAQEAVFYAFDLLHLNGVDLRLRRS
jgi:ATP-dependent DNA ligase